MCTRYTMHRVEVLPSLLGALGAPGTGELRPRYNIPPTSRAPVVTLRAGAVRLESLAFGATLPATRPGDKPLRLANARCETLLARPAFRDAARHRRCLVPADGFFEWARHGSRRQPHHFHRPDGGVFCFAGLWRPDEDGRPASFVIVTTEPNAVVAPVHDRMPVILEAQEAAAWLGETPLAPEALGGLCRPCPAARLAEHRVDPRVGRPDFDEPTCVAPWSPPPPEPTLFEPPPGRG